MRSEEPVGRLTLSEKDIFYSLRCPKKLWYYLNEGGPSEDGETRHPALQEALRHGWEYTVKKICGGDSRLLESGVEFAVTAYSTGVPYIVSSADGVSSNGLVFIDLVLSSGVSSSALELFSVKAAIASMAGRVGERFLILYPDRKYIRDTQIDPLLLFKERDCTEMVSKRAGEIVSYLTDVQQREGEQPPEAETGAHCFTPFECLYKDRCWGAIPENSVFDVAGLSREEKVALYKQGVTDLQVVMPDKPERWSEAQKLQIDALQKEYILFHPKEWNKFFESLTWPVYFIDFESVNPPLPIYKNTHPFEQIPFLYSAHRLDSEGRLTHADFISDGVSDPRREFTRRLLDDLGDQGSIMVYNRHYEVARLKEFANLFPELHDPVYGVIRRVYDFSVPFSKKFLYHPEMKGSFSIKNIAPILPFPIEYSEIRYQNGLEAMLAYEKYLRGRLKGVGGDEGLFCSLKEYCRYDTLVMVGMFRMVSEIFHGELNRYGRYTIKEG